MKTKMIVGGVIALVVVAAVANKIFGKSDAERVIESATGGNADVNSNGDVTVKTDQGTFSSSDKLPADFPTDVPIYPGSKVQASVAATQTQGGGNYVGLVSTDSADKVASWYKTELAAKGWKVSTSFQGQGGTMIGGTKDKRNVAVTIAEDSGNTAISLVVTKE